MGMRFTPSKDGVHRTDVRVTLRLSADDLAEIKRLARANGDRWRDWLTEACESGLTHAIVHAEGDGSYEQRYGKGDA